MSSNMSQHYYHDYEAAAGSSSSSYESGTSTTRLLPTHGSRAPVSLRFEDEDDIYNPRSDRVHASHASPQPAYDALYHHRESVSAAPWSSRHRHQSSSSSTTGPLLGSNSRSRIGGRLATCLPFGRRGGPRRTILYLCSLSSLAMLAWLSLSPSGAQHLASFRQLSLGFGAAWKQWTGPASAAAATATATALSTAEANEAKWTGWEFARDASLVYTWVNGSDPDQLALRVQYGSEKQVGGARDRDNDDLRYSMRSMAAHLPWHRGTIYLVSPTLPTWLNVSHPRIRWINQDTIVPAEFLPVFSSNAIEPFLHLIPGLTERFLVFNDDFMIRRQMEPWDFFTRGGGIKLFLESGHVDVKKPVPETKKLKQAWLYSVHHTIEILYERYHGRWPDPRATPRFVKHAPFVYYRAALEALHAHFGPYLADNARHRFRNPDDVLVPFLHHGYVTQEGSQCCGLGYEVVPNSVAAQSFFFVSWTDNRTANALALDKLGKADPQVAAFNDNMGRGPQARAAQLQMHEHFVQTFQHLPRVFEVDRV